VRSDSAIEEQVRRYATRLADTSLPLAPDEVRARHVRSVPLIRDRRRFAAAATAAVAMVALTIAIVLTQGDDSGPSIRTDEPSDSGPITRPTEPEPPHPEAASILETQLAALTGAGFTGELYGTPGTVVFGGATPALPDQTVLVQVSSGTAAEWASDQADNEAIDQRFLPGRSSTIDTSDLGSYGTVEGPRFPEEWLARDIDGGVAIVTVLTQDGAPWLGLQQLGAALDALLPQVENAGITPASIAALPGTARVPATPSQTSALVGVVAAEIPRYQADGFAGWVEGRQLFAFNGLPGPTVGEVQDSFWVPVHTLKGERTGYLVPGFGAFVGIDTLTAPPFSIDQLPTPTVTTQPATGVPSELPQPHGPPPADEAQAREQVIEAVEVASAGTSTPEERRSRIEDSEDMQELREEILVHMPQVPIDKITARVEEVRFLDQTTAAVRYTIILPGYSIPEVPNRIGRVVLVDGTWKATRATACSDLALGGVACPR
jgi:hypothetical protein